MSVDEKGTTMSSPLDGPAAPVDPMRSEAARAARYAEAMSGIEVMVGFRDDAGDDDWASGTVDSDGLRGLGRAVVAVADEEHAALVAEVERLRGALADNEQAYTKRLKAWDAEKSARVAAEAKVAKVEALLTEQQERHTDDGSGRCQWCDAPMDECDIVILSAALADAPDEQRATTWDDRINDELKAHRQGDRDPHRDGRPHEARDS